MGKALKEYQAPYGVAPVARHIDQGFRGGKFHCPLDRDARLDASSTPPVRQAVLAQVRRVRLGSAAV